MYENNGQVLYGLREEGVGPVRKAILARRKQASKGLLLGGVVRYILEKETFINFKANSMKTKIRNKVTP